MFSVNVPPRGDRPRALGRHSRGPVLHNIWTKTVCMLPLQMGPRRLDPRLVDALEVSHDGGSVLLVVFFCE